MVVGIDVLGVQVDRRAALKEHVLDTATDLIAVGTVVVIHQGGARRALDAATLLVVDVTRLAKTSICGLTRKPARTAARPRDTPSLQALLGDGSQWGMSFEYAVQPSPDGLAQAYVIGADFVAGESSALILGDNIYYGHGLPELLSNAASRSTGASVFAHHVTDPERYGVVAFDKTMKAVSIEEKPEKPQSNWAVTAPVLLRRAGGGHRCQPQAVTARRP
ncbi:dTDP-glucose pyrophosphorylase [Novosphingobium sp. AP12]|nr:dTDP-glucose pyrophosphorylase [Novosphingobium sp. AP12]